MDPFGGLAQLVYYPRWLAEEQRAEFTERCVAAFERVIALRGWRRLNDPLLRRRIIGGVSAAVRLGRVGDGAWARHMAARRGGRTLVRRLAMAGVDRHVYFQGLGRRGGERSGAARRHGAETRRVTSAHPHLQGVLRRSMRRERRPRPWMEM